MLLTEITINLELQLHDGSIVDTRCKSIYVIYLCVFTKPESITFPIEKTKGGKKKEIYERNFKSFTGKKSIEA